MSTPKKKRQTRADREYIIAHLPEGAKRVQVITNQGTTSYKRPEDVDLDHDEIMLASDGTPVIMRGKPGRRPKTQLKPVTPQIDEVVRAKQEHLEGDNLAQEVRRDANGEQILDQILLGLAQESASIEFERMEAERHGQDTVNISAKRARVLKSMADTVLKKKQIASGGLIDMDSPAFRALFGMMLGTFKESMIQAGCRPEIIETTFTNLVKTLEDPGWKEDARQKMKEKLL
jgi:hypothetical protein